MGGTYFEEFLAKGKGVDAYYPESGYPSVGVDKGSEAGISLDRSGNLAVRGAVLTDEGSMRDSFGGNSLSKTLTGTLVFVNGSDLVVGIGTSFTTEGISTFKADYIKLNSDGEEYWIHVASIEDDTHLTLSDPYAGAGGTDVASWSKFKPITGTGGNVSVASGNCVIGSGNINNSLPLFS